jgi:hypothetical protein
VKLLVRFGRTKKIMENMYRVLEKAVEELLIWVCFVRKWKDIVDEWVKLNPPGGRTSSAVMGKIITLQIT